MAGGISFTIGLFWLGMSDTHIPNLVTTLTAVLGWTASSDIHWIVPTLAGLCLGFGIYTVFLQW